MKLMQLGRARDYRARDTLLTQGDRSRHIILITHGVVKVVTSSANGDEMLTAIRVAGDMVGEMGAFEGRPRSASVIAGSNVSTRIFHRQEIESFAREHPDALRSLLCMLIVRLRGANSRRLDFLAYDAPTRLARVLVELAEVYGSALPSQPGCVKVAVCQAELASLAGTRLNTAEKALAELDNAGVIMRGYGQIVVNSMPGLCHASKLEAENPY